MARSGLTRREVIKYGLIGAGTLMACDPRLLLASPKTPTFKPAQAKSVIQIWMWGGPSHLDTFDPKPQAGNDYCGPLDQALKTNVDGMQVNAALPLLAQQADKYSIIRSMTHGVNAHETASYLMQTGHMPSRIVHPSVGAVVSLFKGYKHGYNGIVPPYIVLTRPQGRFSEAGFLGQSYKPFCTSGDPNAKRFVVEGIVARGISDERQLRRRDLLHSLDSLGQAIGGKSQFTKLDQTEKAAYGLMFGEAKQLFDLGEESDEMRNRYGRNSFGQSCLMARRLVEVGVPYITINYQGWDTHKQHFPTMNRRLPQMDQGLATLLKDLTERNLLDSTIIWWGGEFGRSPKVQWNSPWNGGRSHHGRCFSVMLAGGGFQGGHVIGASDATGTGVVDRPVYPLDLIGSIYELMGIDPDGPLPNSQGLDLKLLPTGEKGVKSGGRLKEILRT